MPMQLSSSLRKTAQIISIRSISLNAAKCSGRDISSRRDIISVDPYKNEEDVPTHTGQKYEIDDSQRFRFTKAKKYVNPNIAMELIAKVPPIACKERTVWCDGGDEHLGHPKVYINLDKPGNHTCGYCGLRFYKEDSHH